MTCRKESGTQTQTDEEKGTLGLASAPLCLIQSNFNIAVGSKYRIGYVDMLPALPGFEGSALRVFKPSAVPLQYRGELNFFTYYFSLSEQEQVVWSACF